MNISDLKIGDIIRFRYKFNNNYTEILEGEIYEREDGQLGIQVGNEFFLFKKGLIIYKMEPVTGSEGLTEKEKKILNQTLRSQVQNVQKAFIDFKKELDKMLYLVPL